MTPEQRLKFMRGWLKDLSDFPEKNKNEIECLNWAIKQCQKNVDRNRDRNKGYMF